MTKFAGDGSVKALDRFDLRLHEILLDRRASGCRSGEYMREKQNKPFAC